MERLEKSHLDFIHPEGAFYVFINLSNILRKNEQVKNSADICMKLLDEFSVAAIPGDGFGAEGYIRISYAASIEEIKKGLDRIEEFVKKYS